MTLEWPISEDISLGEHNRRADVTVPSDNIFQGNAIMFLV